MGCFVSSFCVVAYLVYILGAMIQKAGAGPEPIPHKKLNVDNLRDAIKFAISPSAKNAASRMADQIRSEVCFFI